MCCFSRPVEEVADTKIFARDSSAGRQYVVYSMKISAGEPLAMILPIPVPKMTGEDAVRFINLEKYADFFEDLKSGFPVFPAAAPGTDSRSKGGSTLKVVSVGSFEASFVPTVKDFARLDPRFRLPEGVWDKLPAYSDYGFAVFKLKKGKQKVHPMAFEFPRRTKEKTFFPTVHIHDGKVHPRAKFDHVLYTQRSEGDLRVLHGWKESPQPAENFMDVKKAQGLIDGKAHVLRHNIRGVKKNEDVWI